MAESKISAFDIVLLLVGVGAVFLGFQLINRAYMSDQGQISWLMIIAIFSWLTMLILFILLSVMVDVAKKELNEVKTLIYLLTEGKKKK